MEIIAHRGGTRHAPENTLAAFRHAVSLVVDRLECDVQMSKDGELIVIHDETVDRTTNGSGRVADLTLAQLRALDAGRGEKLPTFMEYIEAAKAGGVGLLPEIKSPHLYPGIEAKMVQELEAAGYLDRTILQSFNLESVRRVRALSPSVQIGALYSRPPEDASLVPAEAQYANSQAEHVLLRPGAVRRLHASGRKVFVWYMLLEGALSYWRLRQIGVDGIIVDDPAALKRFLGRG
jgi:glycerophosphoryl diester phosphodiesterase